ncbi:hypothetical protein D3C80_1538820 [compost metagenome]
MRKPLDPVSLIRLFLDQKTGARLLEGQPAGAAHQNVGTECLVELTQRSRQIECQGTLNLFGTAQHRAEAWRAGQIVIYPPAAHAQWLGSYQVFLAGNSIAVGPIADIRHIQTLSGEPFVEKAGTTGKLAKR